MDKVIELIVVAVLIALFGAGLFEVAKGKFMRLGGLSRTTLLVATLALATAIVFLKEDLASLGPVHFTIPLPVPSISPLEVTTSAPTVSSILFGTFTALYCFIDEWSRRFKGQLVTGEQFVANELPSVVVSNSFGSVPLSDVSECQS